MSDEKKDPRKVTLSGGKVITLDPYAVTWADVTIVKAGMSRRADEYMTILTKVSGLSRKDFDALPYPDANAIDEAVWRIIRDPLGTDPN